MCWCSLPKSRDPSSSFSSSASCGSTEDTDSDPRPGLLFLNDSLLKDPKLSATKLLSALPVSVTSLLEPMVCKEAKLSLSQSPEEKLTTDAGVCGRIMCDLRDRCGETEALGGTGRTVLLRWETESGLQESGRTEDFGVCTLESSEVLPGSGE